MTLRTFAIIATASTLLIETVVIVALLLFSGGDTGTADVSESAVRQYAAQLAEACDEVVLRLGSGGTKEQAIKDFEAFNRAAQTQSFAGVPERLNAVADDGEYIRVWRELGNGFRRVGK